MLESGKAIAFGDYVLDFGRGDLRHRDEPVEIQPVPLRLLLHLAENRDRVVSRAELLDVIWPGVVVGDEALTTALAEARRSVGDDGTTQRVIRTLKGRGIRFVANVKSPRAIATPRIASRRTIALAVAPALLAAAVAWGALVGDPREGPLQQGCMVVIVRPLDALGEAPSRQRLATALGAEIVRALVERSPRIRVVASASEGSPRGWEARPTHRLAGIVRDGGQGQPKLVLTLTELAGGTQVWSGSYDVEPAGGPPAGIETLGSRVAAEMARLWQAEMIAFSPNRPQEAKLARELVGARDRGEHSTALALAERITAMSPNNWIAHVVATWMALAAPANGYRSIPELLPIAEAHAGEALRLAPAWCGDGYAAMARVRMAQWRWEEAESLAREGCDRDRESSACSALNLVLLATGRPAAAVDVQRRRLATNAEPEDTRFWLSIALFQNRQPLEAQAECQRVNAISSGRLSVCAYFDWALEQRDRAAASLIQAYRAVGLLSSAEALAQARAEGGPEAVWRQVASGRLPGDTENAYLSRRAVFAIQVGDRDRALDLLEESLAAREDSLAILLASPVFDAISDAPRFRAIVEQVGSSLD